MKKITLYMLVALMALAASGCSTQKKLSGNPVFPGKYADPEGAIWGKEYWIFPTSSLPFPQQTYLDAFSSKDLVNWTKHERIIDNNEVKWLWQAMWAPAIIKKDGEYFLFFGGNDMHEKGEGGIGVAKSDRPEGPYKDILGKPLIDEVINGAQPIDQFVFQDVDGTYYMYYGGWRHCNVVKLNDDFTGLVPFEDGEYYKEVTPDKYVEGPFMFVKDGKYYFMWSEGGWAGPDYCVAYAIADNPLGPFRRIGKILEQDPEVGTGAGHHSVVYNKKKDKWFIIYHRHPLGSRDGNDREVCIEEMHFDENGYIKPVVITFEGVKRHKL